MSKKPSKLELQPFVKNKKAAAKKFGVSERTIYRWMKDYEIGEFERRVPKLTKQQATNIRGLYQSGRSIKSIASKYKITLTTVYRIINNITHKEPTKDSASVSVVYKT